MTTLDSITKLLEKSDGRDKFLKLFMNLLRLGVHTVDAEKSPLGSKFLTISDNISTGRTLLRFLNQFKVYKAMKNRKHTDNIERLKTVGDVSLFIYLTFDILSYLYKIKVLTDPQTKKQVNLICSITSFLDTLFHLIAFYLEKQSHQSKIENAKNSTEEEQKKQEVKLHFMQVDVWRLLIELPVKIQDLEKNVEKTSLFNYKKTMYLFGAIVSSLGIYKSVMV